MSFKPNYRPYILLYKVRELGIRSNFEYFQKNY